MKKIFSLFFVWIATLSLSAQKGYLILSTPEVQVEYQIMGMSANGQWACGTINDGNYRGFLWNLTSGEVVETSAQGDISIAMGVDDNGVIVGTYTTTQNTPNNAPLETYGVYKQGKWTELPLTNEAKGIAIGRDGYANAISRDGKVIVGIANYGGNYVPVVWNDGVLDVVENATGAAYDVSADGRTITGWTLHPKKNNRTCAIWTTTETLYDTKIFTDTLSDFSAGPFCVARKISPNGKYVAAYDRIYNMETGERIEIDLWDAVGGFEFYGVTNTGRMFGYYDGGSGRQAVWFDQEGKMTVLADYLTEQGVDLSNYPSLLMLTAVSEDEKTFGVIAYDVNDVPRSLVIKLDVETEMMAPVALKSRELEWVNAYRLAWSAPLKNAEGVKGYNVYRNGQKVNTELIYTPAYIDSGLSVGNYVYTVTAVYEAGESKASEAVVVDVVPNNAYGAPRGLLATQTGLNDVRLLWDSPFAAKPSLGYCNSDDEFIGFGGGEFSFEAAIKMRKEELVLYKSEGYKISEVSFVPLSIQTGWTINFYIDGKSSPIYSETIDASKLCYGVENRVMLKEPLVIPAGKDVTMGIAVDVTNYGGYKVIGIVSRRADATYSDLLRQVGQDSFFSMYEAGLASESGSYIYNVCWAMRVHFSKDGAHENVAPKSYSVMVDGAEHAATNDNSLRVKGLADGVHSFDVVANYADGAQSGPATTSLQVKQNMAYYKGISPVVTINGNSVNAAWETPVDNDETFVSFANNENTGGLVGSADDQYSYMLATIYSGEKLQMLHGYEITAFRFFPLADADFTFILKQDGEEIANVAIDRNTGYTKGMWSTVKLETPIVVNKYSQYMLIVDCYDVTPECAPVGMDSQIAYASVSDLYSVDDGESFLSLASQGGKNANWMIGMVAHTTEPEPMAIEGYNVYLDNKLQHEGAWQTTQITINNLSEGPHQLRVNPIYGNGYGEKRSSAITFMIDLVGIEDVLADGIEVVKGANQITVSGGEVCAMNIHSLSGKKVAQAQGNTIDVAQLQKGVYVLQIETKDKTYSLKINIR